MDPLELYNSNLRQLESFHSLLSKANAKVNLVSNASLGVLKSHSLDSLLLSPHLDSSNQICDIGSGGGFPVIPLAIVNPEKTFFAIDSAKRKCDFLIYVAERLGLPNVEVWHGRVEDASHVNQQFEVVTARALAPLKELIPLSLPLLKKGGDSKLLLLKGARYREEIEEAEKALSDLALSITSSEEYSELPGRELSVVVTVKTSH